MKPSSRPLLLDGPDWPGVRMGVSTRAGGVSLPPYDRLNLGDHVGDDPAAVAENRARLRAGLPSAPVWLRQVHGTQVWNADGHADDAGHLSLSGDASGVPPEADAAVTTRPARVLAILTADCLPVVIADEHARVLGVAHAGWRGLASGILEATVADMRARVPGARLRAWIGPAIGPDAFEVGADVLDALAGNAAAYRPRVGVPGKWWCDLPALAAARLAALGVAHVQASGLCTVRDPRFYSYRRDGVTGRIATLAWLSPRPAGGGTIP